MKHSRRIPRRSFLKGVALGATAIPLLSRSVSGALSVPPPATRPSTRPDQLVRHASFGAAGMAASDLGALSAHHAFKLICVAEVDSSRLVKFKAKFPDAKIYQDWREMLDKEHKNLDSVNVSTPDHMHAIMGLSAMELGLNVYGQKPLAHDVFEARRLAEFAKEKKLVTQMGIHIHSSTEYRTAVQLVQSGAIGKIKEVHAWSSKKWGDSTPRPDRTDPVPPTLAWDLWLGTAAERPFLGDKYYHPENWRKRLDFGTGTFGDMGCHIYDPVFNALQLTAPISVRSEGAAPNEWNWAANAIVHYVFPGTPYTAGDTVAVTWYDGDQRPPQAKEWTDPKKKFPDQGSLFLGTDGQMLLPHIGMPVLLPEEKFKDQPATKVPGTNHWHQFIDAVRGNGQTTAHFGYAGPLSETVLLGGVATHFPNVTLEWNATEMRFNNVPAANSHLRRTYRKGWEIAELT